MYFKMTDIELKLKDYLDINDNIIKESLNNSSTLRYDFIKITAVEINGDRFSVHCQIDGVKSDSISPFLPIPKKFLRKMKLNKLDDI